MDRHITDNHALGIDGDTDRMAIVAVTLGQLPGDPLRQLIERLSLKFWAPAHVAEEVGQLTSILQLSFPNSEFHWL